MAQQQQQRHVHASRRRVPPRGWLSLVLLTSSSLAAVTVTVTAVAAPAPMEAYEHSIACSAQSVLTILVTLCICEPCAHCHFDFLLLQCVLSTNETVIGAAANANATETTQQTVAFQQPSLAPEDWFLSVDELTSSRGGVPRSDLHAWSDGNDVDIFTTTNKFFSSVYDDIEAVNAPGQIFMTGWEVTNVPFLPRSLQWENSRFQELFGRVMARHVNVSALIWTNLFHPHKTTVLQSWMNANPYGTWLFDDRLPYLTSSHHQKTIVIASSSSQQQDQPIAYVGGIDLTQDRWDTRFHNMSSLRHIRDIARSYDGWIDASLRLRGPVVRDVAANFVSRWNDDRVPLEGGALEFTNPTNFSKLDSIVLRGNATTTGATGGTMSVQLTRTYSCKEPNGGYVFAPKGEISILQARIKAIQQAKNYVYIEDQYFIHVPQLQQVLLAILPTIQALVVVTQEPSLGTSVAGYEVLLYRMIQPLVDQFPTKVFAFGPRASLELYVHSKVVIVDDVFLSVGSANWNQRSMTSDSEVTANVVDRNVVQHTPDGIHVAALAREFRLKKFSEFSGVSVEELTFLPFLKALQKVDQAAANASSGSVISGLSVDSALYFNVYPPGFEDEVDPEDLCGV